MLMGSLTMEEKQLDLNRPLLSVRRPTQASDSESKPRSSSDSLTNKIPPPSPPVYKSDIKSGPVRNPGTVPFQWEHKPGKPKDETKPDLQSFVEPRYVPKLPPGRVRVMKPETRANHVENAKSCTSRCDCDDDTLSGSIKSCTPETPPPHHVRKPPKPEEPAKVKERQNKAVSVRRMRSKYQDSTTTLCNERQNKNNESVNEDKMKLSVSFGPEAKEKVEKSCTSRNKVCRNFGELLASDDYTWKHTSETPVAEKTLYVDTVHSVDKKVQEDSKEIPSRDVVPVKEEVQNLIRLGEEAISQAKTTEKNVIRDEDFTEAIVALRESKVVVEITKEKIDLEVKLQRKTKNLESSRLQQRSTYHIVPPPPLPKAPSDSWLKRTLPTIPPKNNSFSWLQSLGADNGNHFTKTNQANLKWETMVKTSNTQQGFVCFSKETLNPIPEA